MSLQDLGLLQEQHALIDRVRGQSTRLREYGDKSDEEKRKSCHLAADDLIAIAELAEFGMQCRWTLNNEIMFPKRN